MDEQHVALADLQTCLIGQPATARLRVVFLHGYDMRPADLTPFAHSLAIPGVVYAFPQAPMPVSATGYAWWGKSSCPTHPRLARDLWQEHPEGRERARQLIGGLLEALAARDGNLPVMLAGFSQGGMLASDTLFMDGIDACALTLLSSSCIAFDEWNRSRTSLEGLPVLVSHGRRDAELSFDAGQRLTRLFASRGAKVTWAPFDGAHEIPFFVWRHFKRFVQARLREDRDEVRHAHETH